MAGSVILVSLPPSPTIRHAARVAEVKRNGAVLAAVAGVVVTLVVWLAVTTPLVMGLLHPAAVHAPEPALESHAPAPDPSRKTAAVLLSQAGTEVTDFLAPYAILAASGAFDVTAVAPQPGWAPTNGGLGIVPQQTLAAFDAAHPGGADVIVLPNVMDPDAPVLLDWVKHQAARGALVVSVCEGARVLAHSGLLEGRSATTHFLALGELRKSFPGIHWRDDRRYVVDGSFVTSAGVTAAIDASLYVVARLAGAATATRTAEMLGLPYTGDVAATPPVLSLGALAAGVLNGGLVWPKWRVLVPLRDGVDEIELAAVLDAYPRTFAAASASTTPEQRAVRSRHGLVLVPARAAGAPGPGDIVVTPARDGADGSAYDRVLRAIAARFGGDIAELVAAQLQYPAAHLELAATPTPRLRSVLSLVLLLACGGASGVLVRRSYRRRRARRASATLRQLART